ncbi:MAG: site-specific integrase [Acidobacteriota bacterium]
MKLTKRGGVYWYEFRIENRRVRESTKQNSRKVAETMADARKSELAAGGIGVARRRSAPTLKAFRDRFVTSRKAECTASTIAYYEKHLDRLCEGIAEPLDRIDKTRIQDYVNGRLAEGCNVGYLNRDLAVLRTLLRYAEGEGVLRSVPSVRLLKGEKSRDYVVSADTEAAYLAVAPQPLNDLFVLLIDTGLRLGEALALTWTDIELPAAPGCKHGVLRVREGKSKAARRVVPLTRRVHLMLAGRSGSGFVFESRTGGAYTKTTMDHLHVKVRAGLGIGKEFVLHNCRHTFLTRLASTNLNPFAFRALAGHSDLRITDRYVHTSNEAAGYALAALDEINGRNQKLLTNG